MTIYTYINFLSSLNDPNVAISHVQQDGTLFRYLNLEMRNNPSVARAALIQTPIIISDLGETLRSELELQLASRLSVPERGQGNLIYQTAIEILVSLEERQDRNLILGSVTTAEPVDSRRISRNTEDEEIDHLINEREIGLIDGIELVPLPSIRDRQRIEVISESEPEETTFLLNRFHSFLEPDNVIFFLNPEEIDNDVKRVFKEFISKVNGGNLPIVKYTNQEGIDAGGIRRDFLTRIMDKIFQLPCDEKVQLCDEIGILFASAVLSSGNDEFCIGHQFPSSIYKMMTSIHLEDFPEDFDEGFSEKINTVLLSIYMEGLPDFPKEDIQKILSNDTECMQKHFGEDFKSKEDLIDDVYSLSFRGFKVKDVLRISKKMHSCLGSRYSNILNDAQKLQDKIQGHEFSEENIQINDIDFRKIGDKAYEEEKRRVYAEKAESDSEFYRSQEYLKETEKYSQAKKYKSYFEAWMKKHPEKKREASSYIGGGETLPPGKKINIKILTPDSSVTSPFKARTCFHGLDIYDFDHFNDCDAFAESWNLTLDARGGKAFTED